MDCQVLEWINLRDKKISLTEIAKMYGTSRESVRRKLLSVGVYTGEFYKSLELDKDVVINQYLSGLSLSEIARLNNCRPATIKRFLNKNNIPTRSRDEQVQIEKNAGLRKNINQTFFDSWSNEMAYVLGWMATDGCVISSLNAFHITSIDIDHLHKLAALMKTDVKITCYSGKGNAQIAGKVSVGNKHIIETLLKLGITPRKSKTIQLPPVPDTYLGHFLRGVFEGNGTVFIQNGAARIHIYSGSKGFLPELNKNISSILGIKKGSIYVDKRCEAQTLYFGGHERISKLFNFMYNGISEDMILERKHTKFLEYFSLKGRWF